MTLPLPEDFLAPATPAGAYRVCYRPRNEQHTVEQWYSGVPGTPKKPACAPWRTCVASDKLLPERLVVAAEEVSCVTTERRRVPAGGRVRVRYRRASRPRSDPHKQCQGGAGLAAQFSDWGHVSALSDPCSGSQTAVSRAADATDSTMASFPLTSNPRRRLSYRVARREAGAAPRGVLAEPGDSLERPQRTSRRCMKRWRAKLKNLHLRTTHRTRSTNTHRPRGATHSAPHKTGRLRRTSCDGWLQRLAATARGSARHKGRRRVAGTTVPRRLRRRQH